MFYSFNHSCKVAVATPEGDLATLKYHAGDIIEVPAVRHLFSEGLPVLELTTADGYTLFNVSTDAVHWRADSEVCAV
jgi:hypothetical protein